MQKSSLITDSDRLYAPEVHIYEAPYPEASDKYLIFSFSQHRWFATNDQGAEIVRLLSGKTISQLREYFTNNYPIDEAQFERDVIPYITQLIDKGFVELKNSERTKAPIQSQRILDNPEHYPFATMFISLGDKCNLSCTYCFNKHHRTERIKQGTAVVDVESIKRALLQFHEMGGPEICFTGGEPTLHKELFNLGRFGKNLGLRTNFITNGTRLKNLDSDQLISAFDHFAISLDSIHTTELAALWGTGRYDIEQDILNPLASLLNRAEVQNAPLRASIKPTVTALNAERLSDLVRAVIRIVPAGRLSWDLSRFHTIGIRNVDDLLSLGDGVYDKSMIECAKVLKWSSSNCEADTADESAIDYESERLGFAELGLRFPTPGRVLMPCAPSYFMVPSGDVYPCQQLELDEYKLGNIKSSDLQSMFSHPAWSQLRQNMTVDKLDVCKDCELRYACAKHCHGQSLQCKGCTTAFLEDDTSKCRGRVIRKLWLETRPIH